MIRYYYVDVDIKNGADAPEKTFWNEHAARKYYDGIALTNTIIYKSLSAFDDTKGSILLAHEG